MYTNLQKIRFFIVSYLVFITFITEKVLNIFLNLTNMRF